MNTDPWSANAGSERVLIRGERGTESFSPAEVDAGTLRAGTMWRQFRWHRNQRHYPGLYWSATDGDFVGYESRLELARLMLLDFDPSVTWIKAQPFLLEMEMSGVRRRHVPDFAVGLVGGAVRIVDVKPKRMLDRQEVAAALGWAGSRFVDRGWEFAVVSEPNRPELESVRFLAGYRRAALFREFDLDGVVARVTSGVTFAEAVREASPMCGGVEAGRAVVLHLLWSGRFRCELDRPLSRATTVEVA